jgi:mannitol-specific phosphotransferase system IIBC component
MGLAGMALSAIGSAAGAIMYWVVTYQGHGFRLSAVGLILMIAGAAGFVVSTIIFAVSRREVGTSRHSMSRETTDSEGRSTSVHEERKQRSRVLSKSRRERVRFAFGSDPRSTLQVSRILINYQD